MAAANEMGPIRPTNINRMRSESPMTPSSIATPVDSPTVDKAEIASKAARPNVASPTTIKASVDAARMPTPARLTVSAWR